MLDRAGNTGLARRRTRDRLRQGFDRRSSFFGRLFERFGTSADPVDDAVHGLKRGAVLPFGDQHTAHRIRDVLERRRRRGDDLARRGHENRVCRVEAACQFALLQTEGLRHGFLSFVQESKAHTRFRCAAGIDGHETDDRDFQVGGDLPEIISGGQAFIELVHLLGEDELRPFTGQFLADDIGDFFERFDRARLHRDETRDHPLAVYISRSEHRAALFAGAEHGVAEGGIRDFRSAAGLENVGDGAADGVGVSAAGQSAKGLASGVPVVEQKHGIGALVWI